MFLKQKKTEQLMSDRYIPPIVKTYTYPKQQDQHMMGIKDEKENEEILRAYIK